METLGQLPRRLTKLYTDTKTSCDAVIEQDTTESLPELSALHRKYRIQKDRLIAWGLEWSDNTTANQGDIDESLERAGLTSTVTSVLGTIKDILDEAERMQHSGQSASGKILSEEKSGNRAGSNASWAASDRSRYEDLAKELTTSIDTLYGLSRSRMSYRQNTRGLSPSPSGKAVPEPPKRPGPQSVFLSSEYNASDVTLINPATLPQNTNISFRSGLPPKLDPSDLYLPEEEPPPYDSVGVPTSARLIGRLRQLHSSTNPWKTDGSKTIETPVLVEYATYDSAYRVTGVSPPLDRLDSLLALLVRLGTEKSFYGTLQCLGYFEDPAQPRFGLVFELPSFVYSGPADSYKRVEELRPVTLLNVLQSGSKSLHNSNSTTPPLEDRFRLALTLAITFSKIHNDNLLHKDVNSSNIVVFRKNRPAHQSNSNRVLDYALRSPVICSFDLFSEYDIEPTHMMTSPNIYRHPDDPKSTGIKSQKYGPQFDMYGLGLILLEIGLWTPLSDLWKIKYTLADFKLRLEEIYIRRLASKCGTAYMQVVRDCFLAADQKVSASETFETFGQIYNRILIRLQRCCLLDETDPTFEWSQMTPVPSAPSAPESAPLKRKSINPIQAQEGTTSPSTYRSAKRWASEKGSQILERSKPQSKHSSSNLTSLSRSGSKSSQHSLSLRAQLSQSLHNLTSPKESETETMDWQTHGRRTPLQDSLTLVPSSTEGSPYQGDKNDISLLYREKMNNAASVIQRAWRMRKDKNSFNEYKGSVTTIQKHWRQRKQVRSGSVAALIDASTQNWPQATLGYPTPEPEAHTVEPSAGCMTSSIQIQTDIEPATRPKLRLHPVKFPPSVVDNWHTNMLPRLERLIGRVLKDSQETVSIDLVAIGETQATARPTIFVTCTSTAKVKGVLLRKFKYDGSVFDLKVRRGKIRRSKLTKQSRRRKLPHRSMMNDETYSADMRVMNPFHQQRPLCGASIGAFRKEHLPPVSFGGVILVDDEPLGMSVHHLLDAPSEDDESEYGEDAMSPSDTTRSSAQGPGNPWLAEMGSQPGVQIPEYNMWDLEISDDEKSDDDLVYESSEDLASDSEFDSDGEDYDDDASQTSEERRLESFGDIDGFDVGQGEDIIITQPAIDDVEDGFFPCDEDRDDDHLESHTLGHVHASSGIRRWNRNGVVHEIDWALLKLKDDRLQPYNLVQGGRRFCPTSEPELCPKLLEPVNRRNYKPEEDEYPSQVAKAEGLGGLGVHCFGRTSGLKGGVVGAAMSSVRIYRRKTFSRSWHVVGGFGVGGDSGAWVIENLHGRVCGHVLAWCERNRLAYICPMEVLLEDIKRTLGAHKIYLPGSEEEQQNVIEGHSPDVCLEEVAVGRKNGFELPDIMSLDLRAKGEPDKENLPMLSRLSVGDSPTRMEFLGRAGQLAR
ncbi:hypothetical protein K432DRAFT_355339 [Lepidopterella palustris CBS 459.81]|uniref:Protein kinase domain-containing protein n=1 Tax=Lepidopterella palustris CBS 459.81 TaxID=1314670 RepID=A0A8E2E8H8_9PEZI|nr:hypothetical protein K432DRAFT_355339 [Lepidopterella palustris CBS 459.81]